MQIATRRGDFNIVHIDICARLCRQSTRQRRRKQQQQQHQQHCGASHVDSCSITCATLSVDQTFGRAQPSQPVQIGLFVPGSRPVQVQLAQNGVARFVTVPTINMSISFLADRGSIQFYISK